MIYQGTLRDKFHLINQYLTKLSPLKVKRYTFKLVLMALNTLTNMYFFNFKGDNLVRYLSIGWTLSLNILWYVIGGLLFYLYIIKHVKTRNYIFIYIFRLKKHLSRGITQ